MQNHSTFPAALVADTLTSAEHLLVRDGWCQGHAKIASDRPGRASRCASQAISDAAIGVPGLCSALHGLVRMVLVDRSAAAAGVEQADFAGLDASQVRARLASAHRAAGRPAEPLGLPAFNDAPGRTLGEVRALFAEARNRIEDPGADRG